MGLAQRYLRGFSDLSLQPVNPAVLASWRSLVAWDLQMAVDYYHAHPPAVKLLLGGYGEGGYAPGDVEHNQFIGRVAIIG